MYSLVLFRAGVEPDHENPAFTNREPARCLIQRVRPSSGLPSLVSRLRGHTSGEATDTEPAMGGVDAHSRVSSAGSVRAATTGIPRKRESSYGGLGRSKLPPTALTQVSTEELPNSGEQGDKAEKQPFEQSQGKPAHCFESRGTGFLLETLTQRGIPLRTVEVGGTSVAQREQTSPDADPWPVALPAYPSRHREPKSTRFDHFAYSGKLVIGNIGSHHPTEGGSR